MEYISSLKGLNPHFAKKRITILLDTVGLSDSGRTKEDRSTGADKILLTTKHGKSKMIRSKIVASMLFASIVFLTYMFVLIGLHTAIYSISGLDADIQTMAVFWNSPYNYTISSVLIQYILSAGFQPCSMALWYCLFQHCLEIRLLR